MAGVGSASPPWLFQRSNCGSQSIRGADRSVLPLCLAFITPLLPTKGTIPFFDLLSLSLCDLNRESLSHTYTLSLSLPPCVWVGFQVYKCAWDVEGGKWSVRWRRERQVESESSWRETWSSSCHACKCEVQESPGFLKECPTENRWHSVHLRSSSKLSLSLSLSLYLCI